MKTTLLSQLAQVLPGYALKTSVEHDPEGPYQVVTPRHLGDQPFYAYTDADELRMGFPEGNPERYLLCPGDVLFVSRGTGNRAIYIADIPTPAVATAVFYVLRAAPALDPRYLTWYLNQAPTQVAIGQIRTGAGTPIVQRKALMELPLPLPDPATQRRIAELYQLQHREQRLCRDLLDRTERYHRLVGQKLLTTIDQEARP